MNSAMISVENLSRQFGELVAVDDVSFEAHRGTVFGLLGPNGAGKSTTINCISGLLKPSSGRIAVAGKDVSRESKAAKQSLGVVPQELAIYEDLPAIENLRFWGRAYGLSGPELDTRVDEVLGTIGLGDRANELPKKFSGGMKRRLNFGCSIVHAPPVMLLDEPTVGIDPQSRERIFDLVRAERERGTCVLYTTHYMEEAEKLCDSLAIMDHGKLIASGTLDELRAQLGARDVLQLSGEFPEHAANEVVSALGGRVGGGLEVISSTGSELTLTLNGASQMLPAIFEALSSAGSIVNETSLRSPNLETLFLLLTGKELRE